VEGEPDAHEHNEAKWLQADQRLELIDEIIAQGETRDASYDSARDYIAERLAHSDEGPGDEALSSDQLLQRVNEESVKQQEAERPTRSPEDVPGDPASPAPPSLADDLRAAEKAAKIERETQGQEFVTQDHGEGKTPGGGGGRAIF
jgi:hypothetical protein